MLKMMAIIIIPSPNLSLSEDDAEDFEELITKVNM